MGATGYIMEPFDAYKYYMAIKLHFESDSYDAPKYNFKTSISPQSFWKRRDKYHFAKLSRKFNKPDELVEFYISQFVNGNKWIASEDDDSDGILNSLDMFPTNALKNKDVDFDGIEDSEDGTLSEFQFNWTKHLEKTMYSTYEKNKLN